MSLITHAVRFFFRSDFPRTIDPDTALPGYVADMNTVLAKNTDRRFAYAGHRFVDEVPTWASTNVYPATDYEYHIFVQPTAPGEAQGGGSSGNQDGTAICMGCRWARLYHPPLVDIGNNLTDYWWHIPVPLHEFGHECGAALGEYYKLWRVDDSTGVAPIFPIDGMNPADPFWLAREDWKTDPMIVFGAGNSWWHVNTRQEMLDKVRFADVTAAIINGHYRQTAQVPCANIQAAKVLVTDENGDPLSGARVRVWHVDNSLPKSRLLKDSTTGSDGLVPWSWIEVPIPDLSMAYSENVRCIKVHHPLYEPSVGYVCVYDAQHEALNGNFDFTVEARLTPFQIPPFKISLLKTGNVLVSPTRVTVPYTLQFADTPTGPWTDGPMLRAKADSLEIPIPKSDAAQRFFRVRANSSLTFPTA